MPDGLRRSYFAIRGEVVELNARWIVFNQLFASGEGRIRLFNTAAPSFFSMVHDSMRDSIFLSIMRLTDTGKGRLSLSHLLSQTKQVLSPTAVQSLKDLLQGIEEESDTMRTWRNRIGAHNDLRMFVEVHPMPEIMFDSVGIVLKLLSDFLNNIGQHFGYPETDFADVRIPGDGDAIVRSLERDHEHRRCIVEELSQY
jgi:hypothetical protein